MCCIASLAEEYSPSRESDSNKHINRRKMMAKSCFENNVGLDEIENSRYVFSCDMVRVNMGKLRQLVELSNLTRHQILQKYGNLRKLRTKRRKRRSKKCRATNRA